jgi:hypothetical protein
MRQTRVETDLAIVQRVWTEYSQVPTPRRTPAELPHEVRSVDDAATCEIPLPEKPTSFGRRGLSIETKRKRRREDISPLIQLMLQLSDDQGEALWVSRRASVSSVEEMVDAVEETTHTDAG